jgi:osmotically-inducible protein OsmY
MQFSKIPKMILLLVFLLCFGCLAFAQPALIEGIEEKLDERTDIGEYDIEFDSRQGIVTVTGIVDSQNTRANLLQLIHSTEGVYSVEDRLMLAPSKLLELSKNPMQNRTAQSIKEKLQEHPQLKDYLLYVTFEDERAILTGHVENTQDKQFIEEVALGAAGVRAVSNHLSVRAPADEMLRTRLLDTFAASEEIDSDEIEIAVRDGTVILSGSLPNFRTIDRTLATTLMVQGVEKVESRLTINGRPYRSVWMEVKS